MDRPSPVFLSAYRIEGFDRNPKGILVPCDRHLHPPCPHACLPKHKNPRGWFYEENHLEEWVSRQPCAVFPNSDVLLLASQNYVYLQKKLDLLFIDSAGRFHVVEAKVVDVARNNGEVPYQIYNVQMKGYIDFLKDCLDSFPKSLEKYYRRFSNAFYGTPHDHAQDLTSKFKIIPGTNSAQRIQEVFLASGYDDYAVDYLSSTSREDGRSIRLVYYRFYPPDSYIEFWEIPIINLGQQLSEETQK